MSISDAQYLAWLRASNQRRCVLVEADSYSGGSVRTRYVSTLGYVSAPTDTPANQPYDEILLSVPGIRSAMAEVFRGRSLVSYGDIEIDNRSGVLDGWTADAWDGRPCKIYLGDPAWPKADFRLAWSGALQDIATSGSRVALKLRDRQLLLDVPAQTNRISGGTNANAVMPMTYGEVYNVSPVLEDAPTRRYRVHDGQIEAVPAVYMDGATLTPGTDYTVDLSLGRITMLVSVTGRLTADVKGSKTGGTYVNKTADIFSRIAQERGGFSTGQIDSAAITQLNTDAPGVVGLYEAGDGTTVRDLLDRLITGAGGYYAVDRDGLLTCGLFKAPAGTPVVTLGADDVRIDGVELVRRIVPTKSVQVGYARNHTVMQSGIAGGVGEARRAWLNQEYASISRATNSPVGYLLATDGDLERSCYALSADASTEATRRAALWSVLRRRFRLQAWLAAGRVRVGNVIALDLPRYSLSGGVLAVVVGIRESLTGGTQEIEVFL